MKLSLSNFQIHKFATTEIPEGETVYLEGDSDTGKSSRLRAIRWLCENKPDGGSFVTFKSPRGATSTVTLEIDGHVITRERGKSKNLYTLDDEVYEAFGRSVPEPIAKVLKLSPYAFQLQGEPPFLIGFSPTEAAKVLSDACGLGVIDTAVAFVRGKKTAADADIRKCEILMESAQSRLAEAEKELPLAGALEKVADCEEEAHAKCSLAESISDAISEAPQGEPLDIGVARQRADAAHLAGDLSRGLLNIISWYQSYINDDPTGTLFELGDITVVVAAAHLLETERSGFEGIANRVRGLLDNEPVGNTYDIAEAQTCLARAVAIYNEYDGPISGRIGKLSLAICEEPTGELRDVGAAHNQHSLAVVLFGEIEELSKMERTLRSAITDMPCGEVIDTTGLKQQRAQIKVCPTCGREL